MERRAYFSYLYVEGAFLLYRFDSLFLISSESGLNINSVFPFLADLMGNL